MLSHVISSDKYYLEKYQAAEKALDYIHDGMRVGLGTGSTANIFIDLLATKIKNENLKIQCVATSEASRMRAIQNGLHILPDSVCDTLDIAIDGADEFDSQFRLIKGGGGALLREKIIARSALKFIVIADETKSVDCLGSFPLPIECVYYEEKMLFKHLEKIFNHYADSSAKEFSPVFRKNKNTNNTFLTDLGHTIFDMNLIRITDPESLAHDLQDVSGIVDNGLFLNEVDTILTNCRVLNKKGILEA